MGEESKSTEESKAEQKKPPQAYPLPEETTKSKIIRFIVVGVYLCCVSGLGVTLSFYYLFFWDSRMPEIYKVFKKN